MHPPPSKSSALLPPLFFSAWVICVAGFHVNFLSSLRRVCSGVRREGLWENSPAPTTGPKE